jgi:nucleoid-associated protein YgaU
VNRYAKTPVLGGVRYASTAPRKIYKAVQARRLTCSQRVTKEGERLDTIAGQVYGAANYWWVIAAASGIGWGCQVPPGTWIRIPVSLNEVMSLLLST